MRALLSTPASVLAKLCPDCSCDRFAVRRILRAALADWFLRILRNYSNHLNEAVVTNITTHRWPRRAVHAADSPAGLTAEHSKPNELSLHGLPSAQSSNTRAISTGRSTLNTSNCERSFVDDESTSPMRVTLPEWNRKSDTEAMASKAKHRPATF